MDALRKPYSPCVAMVRAEWLILIGIVLTILSCVVPVGVAYKASVLNKEARRTIILLLNAGEAYYRDYGHWPSEYTGEFGDYRYGNTLSNVAVLNIFRAKPGTGNPNHQLNEKQKIYLDLPSAESGKSGLNEAQALVDPWGNEYQIVLDTDLNNTTSINRSTYNPQTGLGMLVWSYGPDKESATQDDILSWRL